MVNLSYQTILKLILKLSAKTARKWLNKMGFEFKRFTKGIYVDGHERPDVIEYRSKFLEQMER